jgi:hypothetical protein
MLSVLRGTVRDWSKGILPNFEKRSSGSCDMSCGRSYNGPVSSYVYLLGLYLGDGAISTHLRGVHRLRIACANAYPLLMDQCEKAMREVMPKMQSIALRQKAVHT